MNILIADDQPALLRTYTLFLSSEDHQVSAAETAEKAFEILQNDPIDLAIIDFDFGDPLAKIRNGIELIIQTRKSGIHIPIILNTSFPGEAENYIGKLAKSDKKQLGKMKLFFKLMLGSIREAIETTLNS